MKSYQAGAVFGDLDLLYNGPRPATVVAGEDCVLWALDQAAFDHFVKPVIMYRWI